jgi:hypothetical protein
MASDQNDHILYWADDFLRLAQNLENESNGWVPADHSQEPQLGAENDERRRRAESLWRNAAEAGVIMFELCGCGAFDEEPRIKNLISQVRSEIKECLEEFKVPFDHMVLNIPYGHRVGKSYDVYFVKIFEGFWKVWDKSQEDRGINESYYNDHKQRAQLHMKLMRELGRSLRSRHTKR